MTKRMIFGTIMLALGMVCASGDTIVNGILAVVFMGIAAIALRSANVRSNVNENANENYGYQKAA